MRKWLKELRKRRELKQHDVANAIGMTQQYYNLIENGKRQKTLDLLTAQKLSKLFDVSVDWIIEQEKKTA